MVSSQTWSTQTLLSLHQSMRQYSTLPPSPLLWVSSRKRYINRRLSLFQSDRRRLKRCFSTTEEVNAMRKTKLIILPTKCLNQMGFLLLFLSCPVIGDWGRIRPESEMSQWSIQIEREGSCGLVRDSSGVKDSAASDGPTGCNAVDAVLWNNTESLPAGQEIKSDFPVSDPWLQSRRVQTERRLAGEREEKSFRRSRNVLSGRRAVSLDRRNSVERRNERVEREVRLERRSARSNDYRRMSRSLDRRVVDARRMTRDSRERLHDRRLTESPRRTETGRRMQESRLSQSRNEEQRLTGRVLQDERNDGRRNEERRGAPQEERMTRGRRSVDRAASPERRIRASEARGRDVRGTDRRIRAVARIEPDGRRIERDAKGVDRMDGVSPKVRDHRERTTSRTYHDKPEKSGRFLDGLKTFFGRKSEEEDWVSNHGDFATTCLVGAAAYFLTTRQVKTV